MKKKVLVIGAGPAGLAAADAAAGQGAAVTLCGAESYPPYWRPRLTRYLSEPVGADKLAIRKPEWFTEHAVELLTGVTAERIDPKLRIVRFADGSERGWDALVLAMGAVPNRPKLPGVEHAFTLRGYDDAVALRSAALAAGRAVVVGGGLLGLETAWEINAAGVNTSVIEIAPWLMPRQLNRAAGLHLKRRLEDSGMAITTGLDPAACPWAYDGACVILCAGVQANAAMARDAGIAVDRAVTVDDHMRTSAAGVFACGDVASFNGRSWGLMAVAQEQGRVAGANAAGADAAYTETPPSPMLKVGAHGVFSVGDISEGEGTVLLGEEDEKGYACLMLRDGALVGAVLVGDTSAGMRLKKAVGEGKYLAGAQSVREALARL